MRYVENTNTEGCKNIISKLLKHGAIIDENNSHILIIEDSTIENTIKEYEDENYDGDAPYLVNYFLNLYEINYGSQTMPFEETETLKDTNA